MDKLKRAFVRIHGRYFSKKPLFIQLIEKWKRKKKLSLYKQAKRLFDEAEVCDKEILSVFNSSDWEDNTGFLKVKINSLNELYQELTILTRSAWRRGLEATIIVLSIAFVLRNFVFGIYQVPNCAAESTILVGDRIWGDKLSYYFDEPKRGDVVMFEDFFFEYDSQSFLQRFWQRYFGISIPALGLKAGPENVTKRIIGVPGDLIEGRIENGEAIVYRNRKRLYELYVNTYPLLVLKKTIGIIDFDYIGSIEVPKILRIRQKFVLYSYDPKKDFEKQPFYFIDYQDVVYDRKTGYMKVYRSDVPATNSKGKKIDQFGPFVIPEGRYWVMGDNRRNSVDSRERGLLDRSKIRGKASFVIWSLDSEEPIWILELIKNPLKFIKLLRWHRFCKKIT